MITTYFNPADIVYAYNEIRNKNVEPVMYCSSELAAKLLPVAGMEVPSTVGYYNGGVNVNGYIGKYKGMPVYVTETVGNLFVIVPQYKEEIKL
jgi:hypothetical protein